MLRTIIATSKDKVGVKKVWWSPGGPSLLAGVMVWREDRPGAARVAPFRRLQGSVKDVQLKEIDWQELGEEDSGARLRVEVFLLSSLTCDH